MTTRKLLLAAFFCRFSPPAPASASKAIRPMETRKKSRLYKNGSVMSDDGGLNLFGGDEKKTPDAGAGIGVNGFLWRATLDTVSFMPITSADPFGGVIITDWYSPPETPNERTKLNVFIRDRDLRADGVKVSVFRQTKGADGTWADAPVAARNGRLA